MQYVGKISQETTKKYVFYRQSWYKTDLNKFTQS